MQASTSLFALVSALGWAGEANAGGEKTLAHVEAYSIPDFQWVRTQGIQAQVLGVDAGFQVPVSLRKGIKLKPAAIYHMDGVFFDDAREPDRILHSVNLKLELKAKLPKKWTLKVSAGIGLAGDFKRIDTGVIRGHGSALASHKISERLSLGGGVYASYAFGSLLPLPAFVFKWKPSKKFTLDAFLPSEVYGHYHVNPRIDLSAGIAVGGQKYAIRSDDRCSLGVLGLEGCVDYISYSLVGLEVSGSFRVFSSVWLEPYLGMTVYRRFEMYVGNKDRVGYEEDNLANGPYLGLRAEWRIPDKK